MAAVIIKVDPDVLRRARIRAFELGTTVEKALARLLVHLATAPEKSTEPKPDRRSQPPPPRPGDTGERVELQRPVAPRARRPGASGNTG